MAQARSLIESTFGPQPVVLPQELPGKLETALALGRNSWPSVTIRQLADWLLEFAEGRGKGPAFEVRWLNLCGFCLRPGFGFPGDDFRVEQTRRVYAGGMRFPNHVESEIQWWIFWGRIAGGLNRNQQTDIFQRISSFILPRTKGKPQRVNQSLLREMWRTASSLELLPVGTKTDLGEALVKRLKSGSGGPVELWCISRIAARRLFYGPLNQVIPPATAARWIDALVAVKSSEDAIAAIAQHTGDASRDLPAATMNLARRALADKPDLLSVLESETERDLGSLGRVFGEELPAGLVFAE
jgi:hypothetical protein